jgi:NADH-quinone oxidoreductase subunit A
VESDHGHLLSAKLSRQRNIRGVGARLNAASRTALPCTFLCAALRVETFYFQGQSAGILHELALAFHAGNCAVPKRFRTRGGFGTGRSEGSMMGQSLTQLLLAYLPLIVFVGVAGVIAIVLLAVAFVVAYKQPDPEKLSAYECGFNAFDDARMKFDVRFYLVAILFIIFDLEGSFLFPCAAAFGRFGAYGFWSMMLFLGVLTIGFIYEWKKGALEWD